MKKISNDQKYVKTDDAGRTEVKANIPRTCEAKPSVDYVSLHYLRRTPLLLDNRYQIRQIYQHLLFA